MKITFAILLSLAPLMIAGGLVFIADGLLVSSAGVLLARINASELSIGMVNACFFAGALACTFCAQWLLAHVGYIRAFSVFNAIFALSALFGVFSDSLIFWGILRFFMGFAYYSIVLVIESWINARIINSIRSRTLAIYEVLFYSSFALGAAFIALKLSATSVLIVSAIFIVLGFMPLSLLGTKSPAIPSARKISMPNINAVPRLALVTSFIGGFCINGFLSMASLWAIICKLGENGAAMVIIIGMAGGFLSHLFFGNFSDKFGRKNAIILASLLSLSAVLCFIFLQPSGILSFILILPFGAGIFVLYSLSLARANDEIKDKSMCVEVGRAQLFSYLLASLIAAPLIGRLMKIFGADGFMYFYAFALSFLVIFASFNKSVQKDKRTPFTRRFKVFSSELK